MVREAISAESSTRLGIPLKIVTTLLWFGAVLWGPVCLAANIMVDSIVDSASVTGGCTLREAVIAANTDSTTGGCPAGSGADTIVFSPTIDGQAIVLTNLGPGEDAGEIGDLDITGGDLTIQGNGAAQTVIDGDGSDRVFQILDHSVTIKNLTITNGGGVAQGGGIYSPSSGTLTLASVVVSNNHVAGTSTLDTLGGGIEVDGNLNMTDTTVIGNSAITSGTGMVGGAGLYVSLASSKADISYSAIANNTAHSASGSAFGGGIMCDSSMSLKDSVVTGNVVQSDSADASGGGIDVEWGDLHLERVELSDNTAQGGGSSYGGGLHSRQPTTLINTTVAHNTAVGGFGGGLHLQEATDKASNVTIAGNSARTGGGIEIQLGALVTFADSIIGNNSISSSSGTGPDCDDGGGIGLFNSYGFNLIGIRDGCTSLSMSYSDQVGTSVAPLAPKLGTLQAVGGNGTRVFPLLSGSPAIDAGDTKITMSGVGCYSFDQVGNSRPNDGNGDGTAACDVGAAESPAAASTGGAGGNGGGGVLGLPALFVLLGFAVTAVTTRRRLTSG